MQAHEENLPPSDFNASLAALEDEAVLPAQTYQVQHPDLPPCELFLSPFEGGEDWCSLEAIFN